jgi:hypothetical protein
MMPKERTNPPVGIGLQALPVDGLSNKRKPPTGFDGRGFGFPDTGSMSVADEPLAWV